MQEYDILFSILTLPEVEFLAPVAKRFIDGGYKVGFILFHEAARDTLNKAGIAFFNAHQLRQAVPYRDLRGDDLDAFGGAGRGLQGRRS